MVNILDIEPEYLLVNDFKGCKDGSILFNVYIVILNVFSENVESTVI